MYSKRLAALANKPQIDNIAIAENWRKSAIEMAGKLLAQRYERTINEMSDYIIAGTMTAAKATDCLVRMIRNQ